MPLARPCLCLAGRMCEVSELRPVPARPWRPSSRCPLTPPIRWRIAWASASAHSGERSASARPRTPRHCRWRRRPRARLRGIVTGALEHFHEAVESAGAPALRVEVSEPRIDDKHLRAIEFELRRGKHTGVVTVKSRGDVTLVGPFRQGKTEGPCRSFPIEAEREIEGALGEFLTRFLEEAATP